MTKLQDLILLAHSDPSYQDRPGDISIFGLESIMKEYAEWYAEEFRKKMQKDMIEMPTEGYSLIIHQCKLPDHI